MPSNLLDIYYMATEEEKKELKKEMKLNDKTSFKSLQKYSLQEKKISNLAIVKKYLLMFSRTYKFPEIVKLLDKSENSIRKLKQTSFKKLKEQAKERKLHFLIG